ncbi:MAG: hypothetical protein JW839_03170 [Candidatus Lokiarchaeota archaeon]|nr:hypothetical protein [Candidatus Lokiarchaeota archaeon]
MASDNRQPTSWEAPKKHLPQPAPQPAPEPAAGIDKRRRKAYFIVSVVLMVAGLVVVGIFVVPFVRSFLAMSNNFNDEPQRMLYLRDTVNYGVSTGIGALVTYGGYKLFHAAWHPKPDDFPLKPSKPGQVLKPGE